jgi:hypothetical protein
MPRKKVKVPEQIEDKPIDREKYLSVSIKNAAGIPRSKICGRHETQLINGKCKRCDWEKHPKRKAVPAAAPARAEQVSTTPAGTIEV